MTSNDFLAKYAKLLVGTCLGISKGMRLRICCESPHRKLARMIAIEAWRRGVREVLVQFIDPLLDRAAIMFMDDAWLDDVSEFTRDEYSRFAKDGWASLMIMGEEDPEALEDVESARLQRYDRSRAIEFKPFLSAMATNVAPWCLAAEPTEAWARWVYAASGRAMPADPLSTLWEVLFPILRLDRPRPFLRMACRCLESRHEGCAHDGTPIRQPPLLRARYGHHCWPLAFFLLEELPQRYVRREAIHPQHTFRRDILNSRRKANQWPSDGDKACTGNGGYGRRRLAPLRKRRSC